MSYMNAIGKKTQGKDFNYFKKFTVTNTDFGVVEDGYAPDGIITFSTNSVIFINEDTGLNVVEISLNGTTTHFELVAGENSPTRMLTFNNRVISMMWFRLKAGSSGPCTISVIAW